MRTRNLLQGTAVILVVFSLIAWNVAAASAAEGKFPTRPIQIIIGYAPGTTDAGIRPFTEKAQDYLGQSLTFVYRPGASGAVGASFVVKSKPDGYTLYGASQASIVTSPLTQDGIDYTLDDFAPVTRMVGSPLLLAIQADSPYKTLKDLVDEAKKNPGKISFSSAGAFSTPQLPVEIFARLAGVQLTHVPCTGTGPAVTALLGGHVTLASSSMAPLSAHLRSKTLRAVGVFEKERLAEYPDIPTFTELGYPVVYSNWWGVLAPKKTPDEVVRRLHAAFKRVLDENRKYVEEKVANLSLRIAFAGPEEFGASLKAENEAVKKIVKDLMAAEKKK